MNVVGKCVFCGKPILGWEGPAKHSKEIQVRPTCSCRFSSSKSLGTVKEDGLEIRRKED